MPMSKTQALEIIKKVRYVYNIDFDKPKLEMWIDVLSQNGLSTNCKSCRWIYQQ
ncbi:hypothetical protein SaO268_1930 [Staphylococcus aureus]|nr:hypothetical protein SaO268_1930 [Staphylococcus aureus]